MNVTKIAVAVIACTGVLVLVACGGGGGAGGVPNVPVDRRAPVGEQQENAPRVVERRVRPRAVAAPEAEVEIANIPWAEIDRIYNLKSKTTEIQKESEWKRYKGKRVQWSGVVTEISETFGNLFLHIKMNPETFTSDLHIKIREEQRDRAMSYRKGDKVSFVGTLSDWGTLMPITLDDGEFYDPAEVARKAKVREEKRLEAARIQEQKRLEAIEAAKTPEQKAAELAARQEAEKEEERQREIDEKAANEKKAAAKLIAAKEFVQRRQKSVAKRRLQEIIETYPDTAASVEAEKLLKSL